MEKRLREIEAQKEKIRQMLEAALNGTDGTGAGETEESREGQETQEMDIDALNAELDALIAEQEGLEARKDTIAKLKRSTIAGNIIAKPKTEDKEQRVENLYSSVEYRRAFMRHVLKGEDIPVELRADAVTMTTDVGAVIPTTIYNKIFGRFQQTGKILPLVTHTNIKGGISVPVSGLKPVAIWVAEGKGSDRQKVDLGSIMFGYYKLRCAVSQTFEVDNVTLEMFEAWMAEAINNAMVKAVEEAIISGTGVGQPKGIITETVGTDAIVDGAPEYDTFIEADSAIPEEYDDGAIFVMNKRSFNELMKEKDADGQPIARVNMGIDGKPARTVYGRDCLLTPYLPSYATAATGDTWAIMFDFSDYIFNTNYSIGVSRYMDNETDDYVTKALMLADGKVVDAGSLIKINKA